MTAPAFDQIHDVVAKVGSLTHMVEAMLEDTDWNDDDRQHLERLAHFLGVIAETAASTIVIIECLNAAFIDWRSRRGAEPEKR